MSKSEITFPIWINGQPNSELPANDRGLAYGDGLFETIRITQQGAVLLEQHIQRLQCGIERLSIRCDWVVLQQQIATYLAQVESQNATGIVKIIVTRGSGGRGYSPQSISGPTSIMSFHPAADYPESYSQKGISVFPCQTRLANDPQLAGIKHLNRLTQVLARQEWNDSQYQEGLMLDYQGNVIEGVFSNLFLVCDSQVITPELSQCGVKGVMRDWLIQQFQRQGVMVKETSVTLAQFELAEECFFCNSVFGVWPIQRYEDRVWAVGHHTRQAQQWVKEHWNI